MQGPATDASCAVQNAITRAYRSSFHCSSFVPRLCHHGSRVLAEFVSVTVTAVVSSVSSMPVSSSDSAYKRRANDTSSLLLQVDRHTERRLTLLRGSCASSLEFGVPRSSGPFHTADKSPRHFAIATNGISVQGTRYRRACKHQ
jgi:hypothetical protein